MAKKAELEKPADEASKYLPEWQEILEGVKVHDAITINGMTKSYWSCLDPQAKMWQLQIMADYKAQHVRITGNIKKPLCIPMANIPFFVPLSVSE